MNKKTCGSVFLIFESFTWTLMEPFEIQIWSLFEIDLRNSSPIEKAIVWANCSSLRQSSHHKYYSTLVFDEDEFIQQQLRKISLIYLHNVHNIPDLTQPFILPQSFHTLFANVSPENSTYLHQQFFSATIVLDLLKRGYYPTPPSSSFLITLISEVSSNYTKLTTFDSHYTILLDLFHIMRSILTEQNASRLHPSLPPFRSNKPIVQGSIIRKETDLNNLIYYSPNIDHLNFKSNTVSSRSPGGIIFLSIPREHPVFFNRFLFLHLSVKVSRLYRLIFFCDDIPTHIFFHHPFIQNIHRRFTLIFGYFIRNFRSVSPWWFMFCFQTCFF